MNNELIYKIAVTMITGIGSVYSRALVNRFGSAEHVFKASRKDLETIEGIGEKRLESILNFDFNVAEEEVSFIEKHKIKALFFQDEAYPKRLLHCFDSPALLYYKGSADLNSSKIVAIVGTRNPSEYGRHVCENLVDDLSGQGITVVSGLAYGIDTIAHKSSVKNNIETIGVMAHGMDRIYPSKNEALARQMLGNGGILTEFRHETIPDKQNFPARNRIVAGISDCVIVIESGIKGGSLITAELANGYNRDVFAIPGRTNDVRSEGCNFLIRTNRAALITSADDVLYSMGWKQNKKIKKKLQRELFIELPEEEQKIYDLLRDGALHIDDICFKSNLSGSTVARSLLMLEMQGIINTLPGKLYELS